MEETTTRGVHKPVLQCHESPTRIAVLRIVVSTFASEDALDTVRADKVYLHVAASGVINPHFDCDVFQGVEVVLFQDVFGDIHRAVQPTWWDEPATGHLSFPCHGGILEFNLRHFDPRLRLDKLPGPGC